MRKRKFIQCQWSTIPPISTKRTHTSRVKQLTQKDHDMIWGWKFSSSGIGQTQKCGGFNRFISVSVFHLSLHICIQLAEYNSNLNNT
jgi:hypothetical protein